MNNELLIKLLAERNRLVIPDFGAFLKKEGAGSKNIVFSPFLKKDDGVLTEMVAGELEVEPEDARQIVEEYTSHIKSSLATKGKYQIEGVGLLVSDENGAITLVMDIPKTPPAKPFFEDDPGENVISSEKDTDSSVSPASSAIASPIDQAPAYADNKETKIVPGAQDGRVQRPQPRPYGGPAQGAESPNRPMMQRPLGSPNAGQSGAPRPAPQPRPIGRVPGQPMPQNPQGQGQPIQQGQSRPLQGQQRRPDGRPVYPDGRPVQQNPDGSPRQGQRPPQQGVRPGPGQRPQQPPRAGRPPQGNGKRPQQASRRQSSGGGTQKTDIWLIAAIAVAIVAILLIIYGITTTSATVEIDLSDIENARRAAGDTLSMLTR